MNTPDITRPICLIAALGRNRVIGRDGALPWQLPDDLRRFKQLTLGQPVVMGRRTWESLGRPLPGRENRVLTRNPGYTAPGAAVFDTLDNALLPPSEGKLWVIGGGDLYSQALPRAQSLYLTEVDAAPDGDAWFPNWDETVWTCVSRTHHPADDRHAVAFDFAEYQRR
ncbi:dihydrofolate reductase [Flagellatimonas centrodinii]|uniref:dihydrofolate reductase n=1 Tax=Flagellatimonas centrodinii TaxID=2806210 RepID=UPI001FED93C0|nr:dihydrofolate reductase [Flagellatimonas centrodinii]ULQ45479.1 dihydrofolate reductase [Flagellatimonas centrodinii]